MNAREAHWFAKAIGSEPYSYQTKLANPDARFRMINKSRRTGVTTILAFKALRNALRGKNSLIVSASHGQSIFVMTEYIERFLRALPIPIPLIEDSKSVKRFENHGTIRSLPNQSNTVRGFNADYIFLDEAAHFMNDTDKDVWQAISPMLALGGSIDIASTPFGEQNLFGEMWRNPNNDYEKVIVNWRECPRLVIEIETTKRDMDEITFDQEFENVFHGEVDTEFPMRLIQSCIDQERDYEVNAIGDSAGFDVGRRRDLSAIAIIRNDGPLRRLVEKHVWAGVTFEEQQNRALQIASRVGTFIIDQGGMGEGPAEWLKSRSPNVVPILFTHENKTEMFLNLKRLFEQKLIRIPFDPRMVNSLRLIKRYYRVGRVIIDADRKDELGHADEATALALAVYEPPKSGYGMPIFSDF